MSKPFKVGLDYFNIFFLIFLKSFDSSNLLYNMFYSKLCINNKLFFSNLTWYCVQFSEWFGMHDIFNVAALSELWLLLGQAIILTILILNFCTSCILFIVKLNMILAIFWTQVNGANILQIKNRSIVDLCLTWNYCIEW